MSSPASTTPASALSTPAVASSSMFTPTPAGLAQANAQLAEATPQQILAWALTNLPGLYQTTAFGLTGVAAVDMLSKLLKKHNAAARLAAVEGDKDEVKDLSVPLIFIDTLYHFQQTLDLSTKVAKRYKTPLLVYTPPQASTVQEFETVYGEKLWEKDEETYDYLVKVEPARRAYAELSVKAIITGRRQSQGADRAALQPLEIDSTGLIKVNPLCRWSFADVKEYIDLFAVPYNALLDEGYKSVGDWHSTQKPVEGGDERGGRWSGDAKKTECGLHKDYFKMKKAFEKKRRETELAAADKARGEDVGGDTSVELSLSSLSLS